MGALSQFPVWEQVNAQGQKSIFTSDYFAYLVGPAANAATGNLATVTAAQQQLTFQSDSYFVCQKITFQALPAGISAGTVVDNLQVPVTVFISDTGSGKQLMNQPVPLSEIAGPGRLPFIVPGTRIFMPNATVTFAFYNPDSITWNMINLVLHGRKIFDITPK